MDNGYSYLKLASVLFLVIFQALVSGAAEAFATVNESVVRKKVQENQDKRRALQILALLEEPSGYINLFEVLKMGTSILNGMLFISIGSNLIDTYREEWFLLHIGTISILFVSAIGVCLLMAFIIFISNVLPRYFSHTGADKAVFFYIGFTNCLMHLFSPLMFSFELTKRVIFKVFGIKYNMNEENVTEDEIISIVNEGYEQGVLEDNEAAMISNIIEFDEKEVMDIMTHRKKIIGIDGEITVEDAMKFAVDQSFSRFPVYEEDIDNIVGILHLKDLIRYYVSGQNKNELVTSICSKPFFVPDTQPVDVLWNELRIKKVHLAIAVDEYGQTAGIVSMEDILEEIVGNISDEFDVEEKMIIRQGDGRYLMKGLVSLEDIEEIIGIQFEQDEYDTLNGFLISILGYIPKDDEQNVIQYKGYNFYIIDVRDKIIRYVRVEKEIEK